jgi:glycine cleavage system H lipoate-binding protein
MTAILFLAMFVTFILFELLTNKRARGYILHADPRAEAEARRPQPVVAGYDVPEHLLFHQGHAWALGENPSLVRVGIDDFAAKLIGAAEHVYLPQRGQWIRQGQKIWSFRVNGELVEMVSPIEGTVYDVNDDVVRHPERLIADPYGDSWLMTVQSPDAKTNFRNLQGGSMARNLMNDSAKSLAKHFPATDGSLALAQDGGKAHGEISKQLLGKKYVEVTKEFFLT